ncbi:tail tape measure protein [Devosia sp.]|uniref:tail tape measure protein n=1 Tax=Devosia sp. TaxID=1871048 RepID=UPI001ACA50C7|nr:tail tape measure protein [Devosia sp.]MBN9335384.1 tail tape measure protein [Devosia sp.]
MALAMQTTSQKIGGMGKAMIGGFVAGIAAGGIAGIVSRIGQVASAVASVGDEARRAGVGVEAFQELGYVARQNRIDVGALTDGMKELNLRADEWIFTGGGAAAEAFERLGYTADELKQKLKDPSALFTEIIGKLGQLDKAAQIRVADEIFGGTGGEKFVQLIEQGEQGIRDTIQEARNLGLVMDSDMIEKAAELDRKFQTVSETVGTALKGAIVEAAAAMANFWNGFNEFLSAPDRIIAGQGQPFWDQLTPDQRNQLRLDTQLSGIRKPADVYAAFGLNPDGTFNVQTPTAPAPPDKPTKPGGGSRSSAISETEKQEQAVKNLIAGLEFEKSLIGLSAVEQAKLNALRQAGAAATDEQKAKIGELVEATYAEQMRVEQLQATFDMLGQAGMTAVQGIIGALDDGKITAEEFGSILSNVLGMAANFFLNQAFGGLGNIFGGGGIRLAAGGQVRGPGTETSDSIPAMLSDGEYVVNARATKKNRGLLEWINDGGEFINRALGGPALLPGGGNASEGAGK